MNSMITLIYHYARRMVQEVALGYAWIMLVPSWPAGLLFAALTLLEPAIGSVGLVGALSAWYAARWYLHPQCVRIPASGQFACLMACSAACWWPMSGPSESASLHWQ